MDLGQLFDKYGSDKETPHRYASTYAALLGHLRYSIDIVLEIGIGTLNPNAPSSMVGFAQAHYQPGGSLRAWRDYFPNATIFGVDTQPDTMIHDEPRIKTFAADSTVGLPPLLWAGFPLCDVIIDDGSHRLEDQVATYRNFFGLVKPGGLYVCEDVAGAAFERAIAGIFENEAHSAVGVDRCPVFVRKLA